jgi:hypothetical protein
MAKLLVMAGATASGWVSAYVVLSAGTQSRVFKVSGKIDAPNVDELPAATTLDVQRFQRELQDDLFGMGATRAMNAIEKERTCGVVRAHLEQTGGAAPT